MNAAIIFPSDRISCNTGSGAPAVGTIYDHPTTQYEQFIERYYGRHKGSGKSKATVISDGLV